MAASISWCSPSPARGRARAKWACCFGPGVAEVARLRRSHPGKAPGSASAGVQAARPETPLWVSGTGAERSTHSPRCPGCHVRVGCCPAGDRPFASPFSLPSLSASAPVALGLGCGAIADINPRSQEAVRSRLGAGPGARRPSSPPEAATRTKDSTLRRQAASSTGSGGSPPPSARLERRSSRAREMAAAMSPQLISNDSLSTARATASGVPLPASSKKHCQ